MVNEDWMATVGNPSETEESMLDLNPERQANSRLSCQIPVTQELDGLIVQLPEFQF
jgi:2Fe-2S ferredoxin